ncbi:MAG: 1-deoxy-D-xylulose-5-phosphate synthase [Rikenellaceae bacterium]|nr:1-deoxy-D-xylulose-5-phosphate synthase [Rikenellaceae bacterium]
MKAQNDTLLQKINSPEELKGLSVEELRTYCDELRSYIIEECATNPGHLASSLGAVELAAALHYVYDTPQDKLVWDVGHQTYPHKIITSRREAFRNKRRLGGISGFPRMAESPYDAFGGGHASVSISAAYGMAKAARLQGRHEQVVAIIGDGSMTGGLAFEGLNNAGADKQTDLLVILNDNNMAIDQATGALKNYLIKISTSRYYNRIKRKLWNLLSHIPFVLRLCQKAGNAVKQGLLKNSNLFESLNFRYFGPIDGHDVEGLVRVLRALRDIGGPKLLHVMTTKGKGLEPAEHDPAVWHAPGCFDPRTGERIAKPSPADRYQDVFGQTLLELARLDERVVGITPAMPSGCSMNILMREIPERCFDVGIAEGHAVTFSAGLAASGMRPFCNIYSSFMQRAYDNVIHDVAIQKLPVILCLDRGGLVGEDGATHHGAFDLSCLSTVPNLVVAAPASERELRNLMYTALKSNCPFVIRYPRGTGEGEPWRDSPFEQLPIGRGRKLREGKDIALLTVGTTCGFAREAAEILAAGGISAAHYDLRYAKPLDEELLREVAERFDRIITVEDGSLRGGVGEAVAAWFSCAGFRPQLRCLGIPDQFIEHGTPKELYRLCGFDAEGIVRAALELSQK